MGMMLARFGVAHEKYKVASLKTWART